MKKNSIPAFFALFLLIPTFCFAQINYCTIQSNSFSSSECGSDCYNSMSVDDIANMPLVYINVDFHFIRSNGNQFQCSDPALPYYAPDYVNALLNNANDYFANPAQNQFGSSPALIDTRFRYRLFGSPSDPCDAIFLYDQDPQSFTNSAAFHIVVKGCGGTITGQVYAANILAIYDIYSLAFDQNQNPQDIGATRGSTINHEMGHRFGLCHAFSEHNVCPDMDPGSECGSPSETLCSTGQPCPTTQGDFTCGGDNCWKCFCTYGVGNNFMGYTTNRRGIARSQWAQMYTAATTELPSFVTVEDALSCPEIPPHLPLVIPSGTIVEWNNLRILNQTVEVQTGATLIIRCEVRMGKELHIVVNRGARLFVIGGTITSQSPNCLWGGVLVHGNANKEQPSVLAAQEPNILLAPDDAGVVWIVGAILKNAVTAISTRASGILDDHAHYGGLVMVNASDFVDNGRAVEFMKYEKANKSSFNFVDIFKSGTPPWPVSRGISIWGCRDIHFDEVHVMGIPDYGILGINFSAKLKDCTFEGTGNVGYGFKQESTMPNVFSSTTEIKGCDFSRHKYSLWCNSTPNMIYGLRVVGNQFLNPPNTPISSPFRIRIAGESSFRIESDNFFQQGNISILASSTGSIINGIHCNIFESFTNSGIKTEHNNKNLEIFGNDFLNLSGTEINVSGSIAPLQGTGGESAGNCFANPAGAIFANPNNTVPFRYYIHDLNNPVFCEKPTNNLSDGGTNNYLLQNANMELDDCDPQATPEDFTESDLNIARQLTATQKALWLADPQNLQKFEAYWLAEREQDLILRTLVWQALGADSLDYAEYLLLGENNNQWRRAVVGIRTQRGNYVGAQSLLNSMTIENQDDLWFKDIMAVNFALEQSASPLIYQLSSQQEALLQTIANTPESIMRGYACALLSFCKGYTCDEGSSDGFPEGLSGNNEPDAKGEQVRVYPNPTTGEFSLDCPVHLGEELTLDILDLSGRNVLRRQFVNSGTYSIPNGALNGGIYLLRLYQNQQTFHTSKIVVLR